jgi:Membrane-associated lipoprotein involved in thiamine biosynthesis
VTDAYVHSFTSMGTVVTIHVVGQGANDGERLERQRAVESAAAWFDEVERTCSRFDSESELARLSAQIGRSVRVSELLFETVRFALAVAEESDGAFDPTVGLLLETRGFNHEHRTGRAVHTELDVDRGASFRDVQLDTDERTITLVRPMLLDLGAVAKGLAIDMAARALKENSFDDFAIDAGGDLFLAGSNADGQAWSVGVRHPRDVEELYATLRVSNSAVCTSGDYERRAPAAMATITSSIRVRARRHQPPRASPCLRPRRWSPTRWQPRRSCSVRSTESRCWSATASMGSSSLPRSSA